MPELPEVETIRRYLEPRVVNKIVANIEVLSPKQFIGDPHKIIGKKIQNIERKGKVTVIRFGQMLFLNIHLKMSGQIVYADNIHLAVYEKPIAKTKSNKLPGPTTRIIITFQDKSAIFFNDLRKFGWMKISKKPEVPTGIDVLSSSFTEKFLKSIIAGSKKPIKAFLLDQDKITGIGNIYANDALWEARINPTRPVNTLRDKEIKALYKGIKTVINEGIKYKGSSSADEAYIQPDNTKGEYQYHVRVYHREGKPCLRDGTPIKRIKQGGRSSFFCPKCQI